MDDNEQSPAIMPIIYEKESTYSFQYLDPPMQTLPPCHQHLKRHHYHHHNHHHQKDFKSDSQASPTDFQCQCSRTKIPEPTTSHQSSTEQSSSQREQVNECCFTKIINVRRYHPEEILVKVCLDHPDGPCVIIQGSHGERPISRSFISRSFSRRYILPQNTNLSGIQVVLNENTGRLTLTVPTKCDLNHSGSQQNSEQKIIRRYPIKFSSTFDQDQYSGNIDQHVKFANQNFTF